MLRPGTWDRKSQPSTPGPTPTPAWASPACRCCNRPSSSSSQSVFSSRGVSGDRMLGARSAPGRALQVLPSPLPPTRMLGLPGKCPSLRAPPRPRRRDRPTDAEKKRERWTDEKKSLNKQKRGTRLCGEGWRAQTAAPSVLLAQLSPGRFVGRCTPGARRGSGARSGGHWEPILQDTQGCWAGWEP